ncbi:MAG: hypothetical protein LC798_17050 [Chloroflexi bacterium]|nr:hypothetical protein [Chloroflexota bacterium]
MTGRLLPEEYERAVAAVQASRERDGFTHSTPTYAREAFDASGVAERIAGLEAAIGHLTRLGPRSAVAYVAARR